MCIFPRVKKLEVSVSVLAGCHGGLSDEAEEEVSAGGRGGRADGEGAGCDHHRVQELRDGAKRGNHPAQGCLLYSNFGKLLEIYQLTAMAKLAHSSKI